MDGTKLNNLKIGSKARVVSFDDADSNLISKLSARGLVPGAEVAVVRNGDPLLLSVDESRWAITKIDAQKVAVEQLTTPKRRIFRWK